MPIRSRVNFDWILTCLAEGSRAGLPSRQLMILNISDRLAIARNRILLRVSAFLKSMNRRNVFRAATAFRIEVWNGSRQRCGHLGCLQQDFNLTGHVYSNRPLREVTCTLKNGEPMQLRFKPFRRIAELGDFNADIPIAALTPGENKVILTATDINGAAVSKEVTIIRSPSGSYPLPASIRWRAVRKLEDVGECTDGKWTLGSYGLRTANIGYDRIFLIGDQTWTDYEVTARVTIHGMSNRTYPESGRVKHVGFCLRWAGHSTENNAGGEQPKWGLHPRGGIVWLTVARGQFPPVRQFYSGDSEDFQTFDPFPIRFGEPFWIKGSCETLGAETTRYSLKVWQFHSPEPDQWDFQVVQHSATALRCGGVALVAHELDVTFGDIHVSNAGAHGNDANSTGSLARASSSWRDSQH